MDYTINRVGSRPYVQCVETRYAMPYGPRTYCVGVPPSQMPPPVEVVRATVNKQCVLEAKVPRVYYPYTNPL